MPHATPSGLPALPPHVSLHIVEDRGLLLDRTRQMVFSEGPGGTFLWCCLAESMSSPEITSELEARFGMDNVQARAFIARVLEAWQAAGLFDAPDRMPPLDDDEEPAPPPHDDASAVDAGTAFYRVLDTDFALTFPDTELRHAIAPLIAHFATAQEGVGGLLRLALRREGGDIVLMKDGQEEGRCTRHDEAATLMLGSMVFFAVQRAPALCAVHAGAVLGRNGCILLPAESGAGKSTLVAALAASGFQALADDTVVLTEAGLHARPVQSGICVKEGSWETVGACFPGFPALPIYRRADGKRARYLPPDRLGPWKPRPLPGSGHHTVRGIVFPRYEAAAETALVPLETGAALERLIARLYLLDRPLDPAGLERLIAWMRDIPCFTLRYASTGAGVAAFRWCAQ